MTGLNTSINCKKGRERSVARAAQRREQYMRHFYLINLVALARAASL